MKKLLSYFWYSRTQRNGILFLLVLIVVIQITYHSLDFYPKQEIDSQRIALIRNELDSLSKLSEEKAKPRIYPFNPNFITDYKGYQLGMSVKQIHRLHQFREKGKFVNSAKEFQQITKVSDSLLKTISPYFKYPDWITKRQKQSSKKVFYKPVKDKAYKISTNNLNQATTLDFTSLKSVDEFLANRIVKYRNKLQGFYFDDQLNEVWNINSEQVKEILKVFRIHSKPKIQKVNINTASFKEVLSIPYIDYDLCKKIFEYRDEVAELQSIDQIKNIESFPIDKYDRIVLYLLAK